MYKYLMLFFVSCTSALFSSGSSKLIVGTNAEFPPFSFIKNKIIVGFDIDIATEIGKRLGKDIELKDMPFDALIPEITVGHVDFVAAGMSYTEERAKRVLFTKSYLSADPLVIFTKVDKPLLFENLKEKNVVVIEGFTSDLLMSSYADITLIRLPTQADGFMAIKSDRADAFITSKSTLDAFFAVHNPLLFHATPIEKSTERYALVVSKMTPLLLTEIQKALDDMESDGTVAELKMKWNLS